MDDDDRVEVWVTSGKRYSGRIVEAEGWRGCAAGGDSLILCEGGQFYVWIHRAQISRVRAVDPNLCQLVARDAHRVS